MKIEFKNATCGYHKEALLKNLSFELPEGEAICVLGANGIGKTTLFKTLLGFIELVNGDILVAEKSISQYKHQELATILSYVPQAKKYSYQFTVRDIVLMGRAIYVKKFGFPTKKDYDVADAVMERLGIETFADQYYSELSGGEQQLALIARSIAQEAKFIIMDEPASNLDYSNQKKLLEIIKKLSNEGTGILMASHSPNHAFSCCAKALLIDKRGSIFGETHEIINSENLRRAYGVDVTVINSTDNQGNTIQACCL